MLSATILSEWAGFACPLCGFEVSFQYLDAATRVWRRCPCCKTIIRLEDPEGLMNALRQMDRLISEMSK
jgi:hypothetical protein